MTGSDCNGSNPLPTAGDCIGRGDWVAAGFLLCKGAGERAAQCRIEVERCQGHGLHWRKGSRHEDRRQGVRDGYRCCTIVSARPFVLPERMIKSLQVCAVRQGKVPPPHQPPMTELLGQFVRVAQSEIEPLASNGVQCLSGIPDPNLRPGRIRIDQFSSCTTT